MGLFDSIKKGLGLSAGSIAIEVDPATLYIGGAARGTIRVNASKAVNVLAVEIDLIHSFVDEYDVYGQEAVDGQTLAERVAFAANETATFRFDLAIPPQAAPTMGGFGWMLQARTRTMNQGSFKEDLRLQVRASPIVETILGLLQQQFGWVYRESGIEEDGVWYTFAPSGAIRGHFQHLEIAIDESDDELDLWVKLVHFRPSALRHFADQFDEFEGAIEITIDKRRFLAGDQADGQGLFQLLQPMFALQ